MVAVVIDYWSVAAGVLALSSVALSCYEIIRHLRNFTKPYLQRYIIRILLMVPIYSMNAWIAMVVPITGLYFDSLREVYESFVIYSFMKYLLNFLQYDTNLQQYIYHKPGPTHIFPLCFLPTCIGGKSFLIRCKHGILQYVVVRPITTLIAFTSQMFDFYGEGNYNPLSGYTYPVLLLINNASQITAMYCLVIFYTGYQQELGPMRPLAKFFSIKLVVFFSFFQSVLISGLLELPFVEDFFRQIFPELDDKVSIGRKFQELLICFDMLIAAIGHLFAFTYKPFTEPDDGNDDERSPLEPTDGRRTSGRSRSSERSCFSAVLSILDFSEEKSDIREHFSQIFKRIKQLFSLAPALPAVVSPREDQLSNDWTLQRELPATNGRTRTGSMQWPMGQAEVPINSSTRNYQTIVE